MNAVARLGEIVAGRRWQTAATHGRGALNPYGASRMDRWRRCWCCRASRIAAASPTPSRERTRTQRGRAGRLLGLSNDNGAASLRSRVRWWRVHLASGPTTAKARTLHAAAGRRQEQQRQQHGEQQLWTSQVAARTKWGTHARRRLAGRHDAIASATARRCTRASERPRSSPSSRTQTTSMCTTTTVWACERDKTEEFNSRACRGVAHSRACRRFAFHAAASTLARTRLLTCSVPAFADLLLLSLSRTCTLTCTRRRPHTTTTTARSILARALAHERARLARARTGANRLLNTSIP